MAIDIAKMRAKIAALKGEKKSSDIQMWKPGLGEHRVRIVPWKDIEEGCFAHEIYFYYLEGQRGFPAPNQFGKADPVEELRKSLYATKTDEDRKLANSLRSKMRNYSAVIVRGEEDKGVQVWSYGKQVYDRLLGFLVDEEVGDITDVDEGWDLKVTITKDKAKSYNDTVVDVARKQSPLTTDNSLREKWLVTPNIWDMYPQKSYQEAKEILEAFMNPKSKDDEGSARGSSASDELEKLVEEVKASPAKKTEKAEKPATSKSSSKSLDDAFAELAEDDDE
jgi:hypothetical protein